MIYDEFQYDFNLLHKSIFIGLLVDGLDILYLCLPERMKNHPHHIVRVSSVRIFITFIQLSFVKHSYYSNLAKSCDVQLSLKFPHFLKNFMGKVTH